ncbi:MAG TPA: hypothetical protein VFS39_10895, partial [Nitrospira sp.]|nr:hypothetical protein [Nitrospira sp.]
LLVGSAVEHQRARLSCGSLYRVPMAVRDERSCSRLRERLGLELSKDLKRFGHDAPQKFSFIFDIFDFDHEGRV